MALKVCSPVTFIVLVYIFTLCARNIWCQNVNAILTDEDYSNQYGNAYLQNKLITMKKLLTQNFLDKNKVLLFAQVMPILRSMNKVQKLALSQLVANQVFSADRSSERSLEKVKSLYGNDNNATSSLMLPITMDIANMFVSSQHEPIAAMLRSPIMRHSSRIPYLGKDKEDGTLFGRNLSCELFTKNICLKTYDYPIDDILLQIRRNKNNLNGMLIDFPDNSIEENPTKFEPTEKITENRRAGNSGTTDGTLMCSSMVKYARPQKARATSGQWKYIVNTAEHTQTLRLERCRLPDKSCAYLNDNFDSKCKQVYNYHRLLSWDKKNGLHMDIYKVPTCCSCHVESYKVQYPPLEKRPTTVHESFPGTDIGKDTSSSNIQFSDPVPVYKNPLHTLEIPEINYQLEASNHGAIKVKHFLSKPTTISKYLQPPAPDDSPFENYNNINQKFSNFAPKISSKIGTVDNASDMQYEEISTSLTVRPKDRIEKKKEAPQKINYVYHPIIDFFGSNMKESVLKSA